MEFRAAVTAIAATVAMAVCLVLLSVTGAHWLGWAAVFLLFATATASHIAHVGVRWLAWEIVAVSAVIAVAFVTAKV